MGKLERISVVWDWPPVITQVATWEDGLAAALKHLSTKYEVGVFMPGDENHTIKHPYFDIIVCKDLAPVIHAWNPDVILMWGDMTRPNAAPLKGLKKPMAICFAGGDADGENAPLFDHIFVESDIYYRKLTGIGYEASIAFGTNTDLFQPLPEQAKLFDALAVGTFAIWKRHELFAKVTQGLLACAVGYMYKDNWEKECYEVCERAGNLVLPHCSPQALQRLYAASRCVITPSRSDGGSQRTVLEAMAMNIPLIVCDSDKFDWAGDLIFRAEPTADSIMGYLGAILDGEHDTNTRDFIMQNFSHIHYADNLEKGLLSIV